MKATNIILAAIAASIIGSSNIQANPQSDGIAVPQGKCINIVATPTDGQLSYSVMFNEWDEQPMEVFTAKYEGLTLSSTKNILSFTETTRTDRPDLTSYSMVIDVPEWGVRTPIPVTPHMVELLKAAYADDMEITFNLIFLENWQAYSWEHDTVLPDYPETFIDWNL